MGVTEVVTGTVGFIAVFVSIATVRAFRLQQWKHSLYYFIGALSILTLHELLSGLQLLSSPLAKGTAEISFAALIAIGLYKMRETAKTIGA